MDVKGAIKDRRSIRKFKRKELSNEVLDHLLEMARIAPSGANRQPWEMVVITDRQRLKGLVPICKEQAFVADCAAFIIGIDDPQQKWAKVDLAIALDHLTSGGGRGRSGHLLDRGVRPGQDGRVRRSAGRSDGHRLLGVGLSGRVARAPAAARRPRTW